MPSPHSAYMRPLAAITLKLVEVVRVVFPVKGSPWPAAAEDELTAIRPFLDLLPRFAAAWYIQNATPPYRFEFITPTAEDPPAFGELVEGLHAFFRHYGWTEAGVYLNGRLVRTSTSPSWRWPGVPEIDPGLLEDLEAAAKELLGQPGGQPVTVAAQPNKSVSQAISGPFGLNRDAARREVSRGEAKVELAGREQLWRVLAALCKMGDVYYHTDNLLAELWDNESDTHAVHSTISALKDMIKPLGVTIINKKNVGYRLELLDTTKQQGTKGKSKRRPAVRSRRQI